MMREYGLPSLFVTLTMAESKWSHLKTILRSTDNGDTVPTNRPLHTAHHYIHRKQELKQHVWMKPTNSNSSISLKEMNFKIEVRFMLMCAFGLAKASKT